MNENNVRMARTAADDTADSLSPAIVRRIERALAKVGEFGEVRLIVVKGHLRFVQILQSENLGEKTAGD